MLLGWMMSALGNPCLEDGGKKQILAEMSPVLGYSGRIVVDGRIVRESLDFDRMAAVPSDDLSVDERKKGQVRIFANTEELGVLDINREGWIHQVFENILDPGTYNLRVEFRNCTIGMVSMRILERDSAPIVVRSDVDMTYLFTDFHSFSAMRRLLKLPADKRETLEGMEDVYKLLRDKEGENRPLSFISGSPVFFKRVLENKMKLDGVKYDEIVLKPFKKLFSSGTLNPIPLIKEQVGYKLHALMRLRQNIPQQSKEVLLGDDTEADPIIYALYTQLIRRKISEDDFFTELDRLDVSRYWKRKIRKQWPLFQASFGEQADVLVAYIHQTKDSSSEFDEWIKKAPLVFHKGAKEIEVDLRKRDWMSNPP